MFLLLFTVNLWKLLPQHPLSFQISRWRSIGFEIYSVTSLRKESLQKNNENISMHPKKNLANGLWENFMTKHNTTKADKMRKAQSCRKWKIKRRLSFHKKCCSSFSGFVCFELEEFRMFELERVNSRRIFFFIYRIGKEYTSFLSVYFLRYEKRRCFLYAILNPLSQLKRYKMLIRNSPFWTFEEVAVNFESVSRDERQRRFEDNLIS